MVVRHYFAYGSNMNPRRVAERGLDVRLVQSATLDDFELRFDKGSRAHPGEGHANIRFSRGSRVEGVVYELAEEQVIRKMDPFENAPYNYGREVVPVRISEGVIWAWTYFANAALLADGLRPSPGYLSHLLAGARFLSAEYHTRLTNWPTTEAR